MTAWLNKKVIIGARSAKAKQRLKRDGDKWVVRKVEDKIQFSQKKGPWLLIDNGNPNASRWVHAHIDDHFLVKLDES